MSWSYFIYQPHKYLFRQGFISLEAESIFTTIAFVFFVYWIIKELNKERLELKAKDLFWLLFSAIFGSLAGGRLWYYILHWNGLKTLLTFFDLRVAGLVSYGMILGGILSIILFTYLYNKDKKIEKDWRVLFAKYIDIVAAAAALFIFIYRMGCFHFGDVPGIPTKLPWGMFALHYGNYTGLILHPVALYLSFSALLIFLFLNWYKERKKFDGEIGLLFLVIYSFNRFWIEFLRAGADKWFGLNGGQWINLFVFTLSLAWVFFLHHFLKESGPIIRKPKGKRIIKKFLDL